MINIKNREVSDTHAKLEAANNLLEEAKNNI
jgi:hypothetical protein